MANNNYPAEFIYKNLVIQLNVIHSSYIYGVKKLLFLGSSCIYPRNCPQPIKEDYLLSGYLETTNEPYAIAKIAGIKMCQTYNRQYGTKFICVMPINLYGPNDNFDLETSHVLPALIKKFHEAKEKEENEVIVLVDRFPTKRISLFYVDDLADASVFLMKNYDGDDIINIGVGKDITIKDLADMIAKIVNYKSKIIFDTTKPDGTQQKLLDISKLNQLGWRAKIGLSEGIMNTYKWYLYNINSEKKF